VEDRNDATHILYGKLHEYKTEGAEEDWFRTLEKDGPLVLVHWWYYPDSFDSWLPQTQQFADPEEPPEHSGLWRISVRWLQDTVRFNELMNEEDYEDIDEEEEEEEEDEEEEEEEEEEEDENSNIMDRKGKLSEINTTTMQKPIDLHSFKEPSSAVSTEHHSQFEMPAPPVPVLHPDHQPVVRVRDIEAEKPQVGSRQRKNEFEPYLNGEITNISQYTAAHVEYPRRPAKVQKLNDNNDEKGKQKTNAANISLLKELF
jgi:SWI/SNF related-matrix-associated actin-dependent regulator of chromatin subfamily C